MSFGGFEKGNNSPMSEINTTPLVDVMLVLLIIFMVTAPLITNTVNVNLPKTKSVATPQKPNVVKIAVRENGEIFWNDKKVEGQNLHLLLRSAIEKNPDSELHLESDKNTRYEDIVKIMVEAQRAGISKLGFVSKVDK